ncbi:MAG: hypothetical protein LCH56_06425 [Proteobacteria bacterium]|nr:hypothetical protein [Pseudomonadota bacterium]
MTHSFRIYPAVAAVFLFAGPAFAQRASENVVATAEDAFGSSIGNESIGLYSSTDARGFSPKDAGNMRIEGLYYDQQGSFGFTNQITRSTTMRVGLTAQSYPFPAPTGIADFRLRLPGAKTVTSASAYYGPYSAYGAQADVESPIVAGKLSGFLSVAGGQKELDFHSVFYYVDYAGLVRFTPTDRTEVIAFAQRSNASKGESGPAIFTAGAFLPPLYDRTEIFGPRFDQERHRKQNNYGLIARGGVTDAWRLQAGLFHSVNDLENDWQVFYRDVQPNGIGDVVIRSRPAPLLASTSGEVRASGVFTENERRHTVHFAFRGRVGERLFGADQNASAGRAALGATYEFPKPVFTFGPQSRDEVRHGTAGASYVGFWSGVGEVSAGVQKAFYRREVDYPGRASVETRTNPWLYNATLAAYVTPDLTFYAGYTRGLEDSGIAPENAANPGEALDASLTKQIDAGLRYKMGTKATLVLGVFEVKKPYFDRDAINVFTRVGALSHRGVELSLSGEPIEGLKIVAGSMLLKARVSGFTVNQGLIAEVPPGRTPGTVRLNANYGPKAWRGFSISGQVNYEDGQFANRLNTLRVKSLTTVDLGARYNFRLYDTLASVRFDVQNLTDEYVWTVNGASGQFNPSPARRYIMRLAADF